MAVNVLNRRRVAPRDLFRTDSQGRGHALTLLRTGRVAAMDDRSQDFTIQGGGIEQLFHCDASVGHPFGEALDLVHENDLMPGARSTTTLGDSSSRARLLTTLFLSKRAFGYRSRGAYHAV